MRCWFLLVFYTVSAAVHADAPPDFNQVIRPLLAENCFACHGPADQQAGLRLDSFDAATRSAIVPGDAAASELVRRITADEAHRMPPRSSHKRRLSADEVALLKQWISSGAPFEQHWAFVPPNRPEPPRVVHEAAVRNPIDRFILRRVEQAGLAPAQEADRSSLARRAALDVTGLPPSPEMVERFVNDDSQDAYEKYLDALFASPSWGEHRARYWMDYARYADTHGLHFDNYREMWAYRDWVIDAFNKNMPFDQFTIENLAGDMLPEATIDQRVASGFNRCNITTNEGGTIEEEYRVLYARDRVETTSLVWLGMTAGCAVCHDHKYDPLTQHEFYQLAAFFNNTTQPIMDGNIQDTPPVIQAPQAADRERWRELDDRISQTESQLVERRAEVKEEFDAWLEGSDHHLAVEPLAQGLLLHAPLEERAEQTLVSLRDGSHQLPAGGKWVEGPSGKPALEFPGGLGELGRVAEFEKDHAFSCSAWLRAPDIQLTGAIASSAVDRPPHQGWDFWLADRRVGLHLIHDWPSDALKVTSAQSFAPNEWTHVAFTYDGSQKAAGVHVYVNGERVLKKVEANTLASSTVGEDQAPLRIGERTGGSSIAGVAVQDLRIYDRSLAPAEVALLARVAKAERALAKPAGQRDAPDIEQLQEVWLAAYDNRFQQLQGQLVALQQERQDISLRAKKTHVMHESSAAPEAFVLFRGEYDQRRERVTPDTPGFLPRMPSDLPRNRLGFAQWLVSPEHPLTARVTVNRFWQEIFGEGLVSTAGDFGMAGAPPTHPELLDWLAVEFQESGWDVKRLMRLLLTSSTYRQAARVTPEKREHDSKNTLLSRGPRFRMDAEMVRDNALAVSGLLVSQIGGPSVRPYQPPGVWEAVAMPGSNTRNYVTDRAEGLYRRSLYTFWKRSAPPASMETFNAPSRESCMVKRERTNSPLQSLVTLNDEQFFEAARGLAQLAIHQGGADFEQRLSLISRRLISRDFNERERRLVKASYEQLEREYQRDAEAAKQAVAVGESPVDGSLDVVELASWTALCNELMNLDEVLNK
ncbi:MAG: DUF1553 domain-containing protein [Planctomycetales bacterium]|nr:DUF1553 domain-containing protein [Planctomycetales bacterium]